MNDEQRAEVQRLSEEVMGIVLKVAGRRLMQCTEEIHDTQIKPLRQALEDCKTLTPSLMDGEAAKERLRQINQRAYAALGEPAAQAKE